MGDVARDAQRIMTEDPSVDSRWASFSDLWIVYTNDLAASARSGISGLTPEQLLINTGWSAVTATDAMDDMGLELAYIPLAGHIINYADDGGFADLIDIGLETFSVRCHSMVARHRN